MALSMGGSTVEYQTGRTEIMREQLSRIEEELQEMNSRWKFIQWLLISTGLVLVGRLWYLQIIHGETLRKYSEINRLKETKIPAPRGLIFDRNRNILVDNLLGLELTIVPQYITDLDTVAKRISPIIQTAPKHIIETIQMSEKKYGTFRSVTIKKHLSLKQVVSLQLLQWDYSGINIQETIIRHYPLKKNGAHLFGYLGEISKKQIPKFNKKYKKRFYFQPGDFIGKSGLESVWEYELKGEDGFSFVEVDARNRKSSSNIAGLWSFKPKKPISGNHLVLTIDKSLQEKAYNSLTHPNKGAGKNGAVVVMKINGEILAWVSHPTYDPNVFSTGLSTKAWMTLVHNPDKPLRNKVIQDHYAPGSIIKPVIALAALQEKKITKHTLIDSPREIIFGRRTYHDYRQTDHGLLNITEAIERSANVFFYKIGSSLGIDMMARYARLFNLGQKTNIKMEGEATGLIPDSKWKAKNLGEAWQPGENLSHAIGQGFTLVTPLQMAVTYNAIATSGKIVQPFIVKRIIDTKNNKITTFQPRVTKNLNSLISLDNFKTIQQALIKVLYGKQGTARYWKTKTVKTAGKTGTAQVMSFSKEKLYEKCSKKPVEHRHHGWFVAFAPVEKPEIIVSVLTEHSCSGSTGSAPIARDIIEYYFKNKQQEKKNNYAISR